MKIKLTEQEQGLIVEKGNESVDVLDASKKAEELYRKAHEYVDLGLPSGNLWATCNIGANAPEGYGLYFSWGNVIGHIGTDGYDFNQSTYKTTPGYTLTGDIPANATYDAATANWGEDWHMPSKEDFLELHDECTWTWTTKNSINGYEVEGGNGNTIFLPAAGYCNGTSRSNLGSFGYCWSSSYDGGNDGYGLCFRSEDVNPLYEYDCYYGLSIRPITRNPLEDNNKVIAAAINDVAQPIRSVTWATLKILRDTKQLMQGTWYRITDWEPITNTEKSILDGNGFDILVLATNSNTVSEIARAIKRDAASIRIKAYKTDKDSYPDEVDYQDYFLYTGKTMEYDGNVYYLWEKYENDELVDYCALTDRLYYEGDVDTDNPAHFIPVMNDGSEYGHDTDVLVEIVEEDATDPLANVTIEDLQLWYCLDNDVNRFSGITADSKGIIYRAIDRDTIKLIDPKSSLQIEQGGHKKDILKALNIGKYKMVDLGLPSGIMWTDCNVGAENPEDEGLYFSWGSVEGAAANSGRSFDGARVSEKNWSGSYGREHGSQLGDADNIPVGDYFDAARKYMGGAWRMPTKDEFQELYDNCTWTWTSRNGVNGYEVEGSNGNTIFMPNYGYFGGTTRYDSGSYWSSSCLDLNYAYRLDFNSGGVDTYGEGPRHYGSTIRPVSDAVDLGLPSGRLWSNKNLGAGSITDNGLYFSWGNIDGHEDDEGYNFNSDTYNNTKGKTFTTDLYDNSSCDAAKAMLGSDWHMPTKEDFQELYDNCEWEWTTVNSVNGYKVTGKNGASIFFPASGYCDGTSLVNVGSRGYYWSTSYFDESYACNLRFYSDNVFPLNHYGRYNGLTFRPVQ